MKISELIPFRDYKARNGRTFRFLGYDVSRPTNKWRFGDDLRREEWHCGAFVRELKPVAEARP